MNYPALKDYFLISLILLSACHFPGLDEHDSNFENRQQPHANSKNTAHTLKGRTDGKGFDLVFVADGFTEEEMPQFFQAVQNYRSFSEQYDPAFLKTRCSTAALNVNGWTALFVWTRKKCWMW